MRSRIIPLLGKQNRYPALRSYHVGSFCKNPTVWLPKISTYDEQMLKVYPGLNHQLRGSWIYGGSYSAEPIPENSITSTKIHLCEDQ